MHASASFLPCTVMRTMSAPASAHFFTCGLGEGGVLGGLEQQDRGGTRVQARERGSGDDNVKAVGPGGRQRCNVASCPAVRGQHQLAAVCYL